MLETEIKFKVQIEAMKKRLQGLGAEKRKGFREVNIVFDTEDRSLMKSSCLLRVRQSDRNMLTFKSAPLKSRFKIREEIETEVADAKNTITLLERLGFLPAWRYDKEREIWKLDSVKVFLDRLPEIGDYLEIEGEEKAILAAAEKLGLKMWDGTNKSYFDIFQDHCRKHGLEMHDLILEK